MRHSFFTMYVQMHVGHKYTPRSAAVFWWIIRKQGIRFTIDAKPVHCTYHDNGPAQIRLLAHVEDLLMQMLPGKTANRSALEVQKSTLEKQVKVYERHIRQYEVPCPDFLIEK